MPSRDQMIGQSRLLLSLLDSMAVSILILIGLVNIWLFAFTDPMIWVDLISDDCYYYLGIARSVAEHGLFQFLPPYETNGFQPLWLALLAATAFLSGTGNTAVVIECFALSAFFIGLFLFLSRRLNGSALPAAIATVLFPAAMLQGMETVMMPAFVLLFFAANSWRTRGIFGSLVFLARLDAISIVVARDIYMAVRRRELDLTHYAVILPVAIAYVTFNYLRFGVILPVSGLSKSLHMVPLENIIYSLQYILWTIPAVALLAIVIVTKYLFRSYQLPFRYGAELVICFISAAICAAYYGALSGWPLWDWYYWAPLLITYYALLEIFEIVQVDITAHRYVRSGLVATAAVAVVLAAGGGGYASNTIRLIRQAFFHAPLGDAFARKNLELVEWVKATGIPRGTMFAMGDRAGSFGYFLGRDYRFLHTEGLVADSAYYSALKKDEALSYVESQNVNYWIADREHYLQSDNVIGVAEPVQGMSLHKGAYVICFDRNSIANDQSYTPSPGQRELRYVFDMKGRTDCPAQLQAQFETLRAAYGKVRTFSLPYEFAARGSLSPFVKKYLKY